MRKQADLNLELMTLPELKRERFALLDKIRSDDATVKDLRRFGMLSGLIAAFEQAKIITALKINGAAAARVPENSSTAIKLDCDICRHAKATVFTTDVVDGKLRKRNFCDPCSKRMNNQLANLLESVSP